MASDGQGIQQVEISAELDSARETRNGRKLKMRCERLPMRHSLDSASEIEREAPSAPLPFDIKGLPCVQSLESATRF